MASDPIDDPAIPGLISPGRLSTYLASTGGDKRQAVRLYAWNVAASAALWGDFNVLEIALRNALNDQLTVAAGQADWWNASIPFHRFEVTRLTQAVHEVTTEKGRSATPGHVVAELSLGFWTGLLGNKYHQRLWVPFLQHAFPHMIGTRRALHADLERLRRLRNRVAHHEPVFARNLAHDHGRTLAVLEMICAPARVWVAHDSRLPSVLAERQLTISGQLPTSF